jgi:amino acid transporter
MSSYAVPARDSTVTRALARDRIGVPPVLAFILASIAPMTVCAGVITTAYAVTGLTGIPFAFIAIAVVLALFIPGYLAMARRIRNTGAFYAFISAGLGRVAGVAAALMALAGYECFQVASYGALGVTAQSEALTYLHASWPWWVWALAFWALVAILGLAKVTITSWVLAALTGIEIIIIVIETACGLASPAGGHLVFGPLSPASWTSAGKIGVAAVIALTGFTGFEQSAVLSEEARNPRRTVPLATCTAVAAIMLLYVTSSWAMAVHAGPAHVAASAAQQGPGLLYTLSSTTIIGRAAQVMFTTSLFAAALSYHNATFRYLFSLSREGVLPERISRTGRNSVPCTASLIQSGTGLAVITAFAVFGWPPMTGLFFGGGATGGLGVMILLAITSAAVIRYYARNPASGENAWTRITLPAVSFVLLTTAVILAIWHYGTLLGTAPGNPAAWVLPAMFGVAAAAGLAWGAFLKSRRPAVYATIGLGHLATTRTTVQGAWT